MILISALPYEQLDRLAARSDHGAWSSFIHVYEPVVRQYVADVFQGADGTDDVVQEVFLWLYTHDWKLRSPHPGSFRCWLRKVAVNLALKSLRRRRRHHLPADPVVLDKRAGEKEYSHYEFDESDRSALVERAKTLIRKEFRAQGWEIFRRVYENREDPDTVARSLGISRNAIHIYGCRIINRLKTAVRDLMARA